MGNNGNGQPATGDTGMDTGAFRGGVVPPVLIAAGGTGGHVIPAQAAAQAIRRAWPGIPVEFVCGMRPVELNAYWNHREHPYLLRCGKAPGTGLGGLQRWLQLLRVIGPAHSLVTKLKPRVVLGMGGYIAAPVLLAAVRKRIPIVLHESNAVSGRTTRLYSRCARQVLLAYPSAAKGLSSRVPHRVVGTPVRRDLFEIPRAQGAEVFGLDPARRTLLVLGGSQGSHALNTAILESLPTLDSVARRLGDVQVLWSSGTTDHGRLVESVGCLSLERVAVRIYPTIQRMDAAYAATDLVVSRAGAGTLSEISALGLPSILVPFPHAKDDHQRHNSRLLTSAGAALLLEETDLGSGALMQTIERLLGDPEALQRMAQLAKVLAMPHAAEEVARTIVQIGYPELPGIEPSPVPAVAGTAGH